MKKEIIEKYIQFAIDNWYKFNVEYNYNRIVRFEYREAQRDVVFTTNTYFSIFWHIELITSKEFIEAVARWLDKVDINSLHWWKIYITRLRWFFIWNYDSPNLVDTITHKQAIAIRDEKLEEFINNLIL